MRGSTVPSYSWPNNYFQSISKLRIIILWQSQVENEHYSTLSGLIRLVISLKCSIEITLDFLCPFMND